jgi:hypothetical protein
MDLLTFVRPFFIFAALTAALLDSSPQATGTPSLAPDLTSPPPVAADQADACERVCSVDPNGLRESLLP